MDQKIDDILRPWKAAGMGGENAVRAAFHVVIPGLGLRVLIAAD